MNPIKIAIVGVGNCASALIQGIAHYQDSPADQAIPGVMMQDIGGYKPWEIEVVAAYDVDTRKVEQPLGEAIFADPNCARVFCPDVSSVVGSTVVEMGPVLDGVSAHMIEADPEYGFVVHESVMVDAVESLKASQADILVNYLPVGSEAATKFWAGVCLEAGVAFCNCIPVFIASDDYWAGRFAAKGLPIIGDDMRSQIGASIFSQVLQELAFDRGATVKYHQQINIGGNSDFLNMMNQDRLASKKKSKENVIRATNEIHDVPVAKESLFAGPSTWIPYLKDNKVAHFRLELEGFGGAPIEIDAKLSVQDSENSAGVVIDAIRYLKVAREMGVVGALRGPSAWTQKTPPLQLSYSEAKKECWLLANRLESTHRGGLEA